MPPFLVEDFGDGQAQRYQELTRRKTMRSQWSQNPMPSVKAR